MILQALTHYYEDLLEAGKIGRPGWSQVKVSYGLELDEEGHLVQLLHLQQEGTRGKKTALVPRELLLPAQVKRSVAVAANFLCDNSGYLLGADSKGKPERTASCFAAFAGGKRHRPLFCALGPRSGFHLSPAAGGLGRLDEGRQPDLLL